MGGKKDSFERCIFYQKIATIVFVLVSSRSSITRTTPSPVSMMTATQTTTKAACRVTMARARKMKCRCPQRSPTATWSGTIPTWESEHPSSPCESALERERESWTAVKTVCEGQSGACWSLSLQPIENQVCKAGRERRRRRRRRLWQEYVHLKVLEKCSEGARLGSEKPLDREPLIC